VTGCQRDAADFLDALRTRNYSPATVRGRELALRQFALWCEERSLLRSQEITRPILERYQHHLFVRRKPDGAPLSWTSQAGHLTTLRLFFRWLMRDGRIEANPASELELPRQPQRLPRDVLSVEEVERVLAQANVLQPLGLRDRAIMEVLYATGLRRTELTRLLVWDVDQSRQTLFVREGKGGRDRVVPLGERALHWLDRYRSEVRPLLLWARGEEHLFLTMRGEPLAADSIGPTIAGYIDKADIGKRGGCHLFRHTCATLMLEGGADVRYVQEMLGHAKLETTQIYTRVAISALRQVHAATHPGARLPAPSAAVSADAGTA
jgi:integrase/recombinase XerD